MTGYSIALFLHILGAFGFFVALGLEWTSLRHLRRASTVEQVREWIRVPAELGWVGMVAMVTLLAAGIYMMITVWGGKSWIVISLGSLIPMSILGMAVSRRRIVAIRRSMTMEHGMISHALHHSLLDPLLWLSMQTRLAIAVGIVFLMTVKPGLIGSLLTIGVAIVLGIASSLPTLSRERAQKETAM